MSSHAAEVNGLKADMGILVIRQAVNTKAKFKAAAAAAKKKKKCM